MNINDMPASDGQMQEILIELLRTKERALQYRQEGDAILQGISALSGAASSLDVFEGLMDVLKPFLQFENGIILQLSETNGLEEVISTNQELDNIDWIMGPTFERVLKGETIVLFQPQLTTEFQRLLPEQQPYCSSVLITGLNTKHTHALLIFMHSSSNVFNASSKSVLNRFEPLITQALVNIEYRDSLTTLVDKRTEQLKASEQRFKNFAETASDWFWEIDSEHCFSHFSGGAAGQKMQIHELSAENIEGQDISFIYQLVVEGSFPTWHNMVEQLYARTAFYNVEIEFESKISGKKVWTSLSGFPVFDELKNYRGFRGTGKDVSIAKTRELELKKANEQAQAANKAKSDFLAMMSHEIRTPMNAVIGLLEVMQSNVPSAQQKKLLENAQHSASLLQTLINDVLDFSKIESGSIEIEAINFDLKKCVNRIITQLKPLADSKGIDLQLELPDDISTFVVGDSVRISQILLNLVNNAIKFTEQGFVKLSLKNNKGQIHFEISDTGIGIENSKIDQLFQPFNQIDASITRRFGGTGLGLSISKRLVELMGGVIGVGSKFGDGSCFWFDLSLPKALQPIDDTQHNVKVSRGLTVLVAEDNPVNQLVIRLMLEQGGHSVVMANDGLEAVNLAKTADFDVLLMDMQMPVMDGVAATKVIINKLNIQTPIIALTANATEGDKKICLEAGMSDFITKPINKKILFEKLSKY